MVSSNCLPPGANFHQELIIQFLIANFLEVVDIEEMGVVDFAFCKIIQFFQDAVI
ncbi:hypothetical protein D3C73_1413680 [compost metagenome]